MSDPVDREYRVLFENSSDLLLVANAQTLRILHFNLPALMFCGTSAAELTASTVADFLATREGLPLELSELIPALSSAEPTPWQPAQWLQGNTAVPIDWRCRRIPFYHQQAVAIEARPVAASDSPEDVTTASVSAGEEESTPATTTAPQGWLDKTRTLPALSNRQAGDPSQAAGVESDQAQVARLEFLAAEMPGMIFQTCGGRDGKGFFVPYVNDNVHEFAGWTAAEIYESPLRLLQMVHYEDWPHYCDTAFAAMMKSAPFQIDMRVVSRLTGKVCWMRAMSRPTELPDGRQLWNGLALDISHLKQAESRADAAHEELERRYQHSTEELLNLQQRSSRLQAALSRAARGDLMRELTSGFAHEVHQPLASISNYAGGALNVLEEVNADNPAAGEYRLLKSALNEIRSESLEAAGIVRRIRHFVSDRGRNREWCDVEELLHDALRVIEHHMDQHEVTLDYTPPEQPAELFAECVSIMQAVIDVLTNAIEAVMDLPPAERRIEMTAKVGDDRVTITIRDYGPGISETIREAMFDQFFTTKPDSLGLGLPLARTVIETHQGKLNWLPTAGPGTTFEIALPCPQRPAQ